eukprot:11793534-Alexandrium_andersonii.AAC.1
MGARDRVDEGNLVEGRAQEAPARGEAAPLAQGRQDGAACDPEVVLGRETKQGLPGELALGQMDQSPLGELREDDCAGALP